MPQPTPDQVKAVLEILVAVGDAIKELGRVPSGHLYARLMDKLSLEQYNTVIRKLKETGLVKEEAHELIWIGPR
jgi:hypothetical protein